MKKIPLILLAVLMVGSAFAADFKDTYTMWGTVADRLDFSNFENYDGFTAAARGDNQTCAFYGIPSNWLFNPNETTVNVSVTDNFSEEQLAEKDYIIMLGAVDYRIDELVVSYTAPYTGAGNYTLSLVDAAVPADTTLPMAMFGIYAADPETGQPTHDFMTIPGGGRLSVKFGSPETAVPEPASAAYGLLGLGSLIGIKRRIKK